MTGPVMIGAAPCSVLEEWKTLNTDASLWELALTTHVMR